MLLTPLLRARSRRDRLYLFLWIGGTVVLAYSSVVGVRGSYGTAADRQSLLLTALANPVIMLFRGLPSGPGEGAFTQFLIFPFLAMMAAFMSIFLAVRHTRADEESGQAELVSATRAGRTLPFVATVVHGVRANLVLGLLVALTFSFTGLPGVGAWTAGLGAAAVGIVFLCLALVTAEIMPTPRAANSTAVWILLVSFFVGGIGNALGTADVAGLRVSSSWLSYLSVFGIAEQTRSYDTDALWPSLVCLITAAVLAVAAASIHEWRDVGASLIAERRGRASAPRALTSTSALAWRTNRGAIIGWAIGGFFTGVLATSLASVLNDAASQNPTVAALIAKLARGGNLAQGAVVIFFIMLGVLAASSAVQVMSRARIEESRGTAEVVLATPTSRGRWFRSYISVAACALVITIAGAVLGAVVGIAGQKTPDWGLMATVWWTALGQAIAAAVFLALAALVFVVLPRSAIAVGWALVLVGLTIGLFGPLFDFPTWVTNLAPFSATITMAGNHVDAQSAGWLFAAALIAGVVAMLLMRRRELATG